MVKCKDFGEVDAVVVHIDCDIDIPGFLDERDKLWFSAHKLIDILRYGEPAEEVIERFCDNTILGTMIIHNREKVCEVIPEEDMWSLIIHAPSRKAREFRRFICRHLVDYNEETDNALCRVIDEE